MCVNVRFWSRRRDMVTTAARSSHKEGNGEAYCVGGTLQLKNLTFREVVTNSALLFLILTN